MKAFTVTLFCDHYDERWRRSCHHRFSSDAERHAHDAATNTVRDARMRGWSIDKSTGRALCPGHALDPETEDVGTCTYCGGPADHGRECLPASLGGTMPDAVVLEDPLHRLANPPTYHVPAFPGFTNGDPS